MTLALDRHAENVGCALQERQVVLHEFVFRPAVYLKHTKRLSVALQDDVHGAMDAMLALALTLHVDPVFVGAHHLSRFIFVSIATPGIVHLYGKAQDDLDD